MTGGFVLPVMSRASGYPEGNHLTDSRKTLISALLDRSGSMDSLKEATEDGWRELINAQRQNPGHCQVTLAHFDTEYELLYPPTDIGLVPEFVVIPRGMTALLDSVGRFITEVGERLSTLPEDQRPGQVICLIMTDGMENASHEWTWDAVKALITQQREVYQWEFIFLGADMDAVEVGARMGMDRNLSMTYDKTSYTRSKAAYGMVSSKIAASRRRGSFAGEAFSDEERAAAMGAPEPRSEGKQK
jgi:hypothetical protein